MKKRILCLMLLVTMLAFSLPVSAFTFPEPDWGALLKEKTNMVKEAEFELYAEAPMDTAPFYGARLEPRGGTLLGSVAETSEKLLPLGVYFTSVDDMNQTDLYYPANQMVQRDNVAAMVGWTIHNLDNVNYDQVRRTLDTLNQYNKPMYIRFANEMNCSSLGDNPQRYVEVFRNVANMIHEYPNFAVVWSPIDLGALDRPFEYFYPGDEYVDWVGVSCYQMKYFMGNQNTDYKDSVYFMTGDYSWATNRIKPFMEFLERNNIQKPVMISEGGVSTGNIYGEDNRAWAEPRLRNMLWYLVMKYPRIKMINFFDVRRSAETEWFDISGYPYAVELFLDAKNNGPYITEYGTNAEFVFQKANDAGTLIAKEGVVPVYTMAYAEKTPETTVNYYIDDVWYHGVSQIPYRCNLNLSGLTDGMHTLRISSGSMTKEYTFYKRGNGIRFGGEPDSALAESGGQQEITVIINGTPVAFDQPPIIQNDRTLVPLRAIFEALGGTVGWDDVTQTVTSVKGDITVRLTIGSNLLYVNEAAVKLDVPAQLVNGRTLVPARAVAESFRCKVDWDEKTQTVLITN